MSVEAMSWAMWQQRVTDPIARHVLLVLANYANDNGDAFPSVATLRALTHLGERTIRSKLALLEQAQLIRAGNQALAGAYISHGGKCPVVWELLVCEVPKGSRVAQRISADLDAGARGSRPSRGAGAAPLPETRGAGAALEGCSSCAPGVQELPSRGAGAAPYPLTDPSTYPGGDPGSAAMPLPAGSEPGLPIAAATGVPVEPVPPKVEDPPPESVKAKLFDAKLLVSLGVDPQHAADWIVVRKRKNAANTLTALAGVQAEVVKVGCTLAAAIQLCAENNWQGFKASWPEARALKPGTNGVAMPKRGAKPSTMSAEERDAHLQQTLADLGHVAGAAGPIFDAASGAEVRP